MSLFCPVAAHGHQLSICWNVSLILRTMGFDIVSLRAVHHMDFFAVQMASLCGKNHYTSLIVKLEYYMTLSCLYLDWFHS